MWVVGGVAAFETVLAVILLCLLPRWVLCFLVAALALGCGALVVMRR